MEPGHGEGSQESAIPTLPSAISPLPIGVKIPINNVAPITTESALTILAPHESGAWSKKHKAAWTIAVLPNEARSNNRPIPGRPPGNVEKDRCNDSPSLVL